jgi:hypothetical protein
MTLQWEYFAMQMRDMKLLNKSAKRWEWTFDKMLLKIERSEVKNFAAFF